jgi:hypothetical protein
MSGNLRPAKVPESQIDLAKPEWREYLERIINRKPQFDEIHLVAAGIIYFGDDSTNGSWRIVRSGDDLLIQRLESGTWTTKSTIAAV